MSFPAGVDGLMLAAPMSTVARSQRAAVGLLAGRPGWVHELKADGIRALMLVQDGAVRLVNRRAQDITHRYPEVVARWSDSGVYSGIYDGEIVVVGAGGIDFDAIHRRDALSDARKIAEAANAAPAAFLAFDLLRWNGLDQRGRSLGQRRELLAHSGVDTVPATGDLPALWELVQANGWEGVVCKRLDSLYVPRRSSDWIKIKQRLSATCIVIAVEAGTGARQASFGALRLGLFDVRAGSIRDVGSVGSGFTDAQLAVLAARHGAGELVGAVVEVGFLDVAPTGTLRQPVFLGVREDVERSACTTEQVDARARSHATRS